MRVVFLFLMTMVISWGASFDSLDRNISNKLKKSSISNWQDIDRGVQKFIVDNNQNIIDNIIINIDKPIMDANHTINSELPRILLKRDDYLILMTYIKYLIYNNQYNKTIEIYKRVVNGINSIDNYFEINIIFKIVISRMVLKSLEYDFKYLPLESIKSLKATNPKLFKLGYNDFRKAQKIKETPYMLLKNYKVIKLSDIISKIYNQNDAKEINISLKKLLDNYYKNFDNLYTKANYTKFKRFFKQYKKAQKEFISKHILDIMALHIRIKKYFDISNDNYYSDIFKDIKISPFIDIPLLLNRKIEPNIATKIFYYIRYKDNRFFMESQTDLLKIIHFNKRVIKLLDS